jgi:hypothetical protein
VPGRRVFPFTVVPRNEGGMKTDETKLDRKQKGLLFCFMYPVDLILASIQETGCPPPPSIRIQGGAPGGLSTPCILGDHGEQPSVTPDSSDHPKQGLLRFNTGEGSNPSLDQLARGVKTIQYGSLTFFS